MPAALPRVRSPYELLLGETFHTLHPNVRTALAVPLRAEGTFEVVQGDRPLTGALVTMLKLPAAGKDREVTLNVVPAEDATDSCGVAWDRRIGSSLLQTVQYARGGRLVERLAPGMIQFALRVERGDLLYESSGMRAFGVRVPDALAPAVRARVRGSAAGWVVDVLVEWRGRLLCRYGGPMQAVRDAA